MGRSKIEWLQKAGYVGATWNTAHGCDEISPACANCWAERMAKRLAAMGVKGYDKQAPFDFTLHPERLDEPLYWTKPHLVFPISMGDIGHKDMPYEMVAAMWQVMAATPQHTYLVLTKRPGQLLRSMRRILTAGLDGTERGSFEALEHAGRRYVAMLPQASQAKLRAGWGCCGELGQVWPLRNVWVGITAENQAQFDKRVYWLESIPAYKRWVSVEPLLGLLRFGHMKRLLDWIVVGGESGNKARIMQKDWLQAVVNEAQREFWGGPVPAYFKQWGAWGPVYDIGEGEAIAGRSSYVEQVGGVRYVKVGKKRAGNVLNGERIEQFPAFWKPNE